MNGKLCAASIDRAKTSANSTHTMRHARPLIVLPVSLTLLCVACFTTNDSTLWFEKPAKFAT
ncbi:hypothetical protein DND90_22955 [Pseudomonas syringae pv. maculicola]|nr:hypothetical protein DND90_22955 [Pseudomonas syringae pv. maculicola]